MLHFSVRYTTYTYTQLCYGTNTDPCIHHVSKPIGFSFEELFRRQGTHPLQLDHSRLDMSLFVTECYKVILLLRIVRSAFPIIIRGDDSRS